MRTIQLYEEDPFQDFSEDKDQGFLDFAAEVLGKDQQRHQDFTDYADSDEKLVTDDEPEYEPGRRLLSTEDLERMAAEPDGPISEDAQIKDALREQHHAEKFGPEDPRTDDEMLSAYRQTLGEESNG